MEQKLNICMLFEFPKRFGPIELGPANRKGITSYLTAFGHKITWVIPREDAKGLQQFHMDNIHIFAMSYTHFINDSLLIGKIFNKVLNAPKRIRYILNIFKKGNFNLIYVKSDWLDEFIAIYLKKKYKIPFVFDSEPLGMHSETYGTKSLLPSLVGKIHTLLTVYIMKRADLITPSSRWFADKLKQMGTPEYKLMPYPNGVDIAKLSGKNGVSIREEYRLNNYRVIIYVGAVDRARNLDLLIQTFSTVRKTTDKVKLLIVGEGNDRKNLQQLTRELNLEKEIIFTGHIEGSKVPLFIAASDIGVSPVPPLDCYKIGSPLKLFEYMGGAKPVVANEEIFDQKEVLEQSGGGIIVKFNSDAFADALIYLLNNENEAVVMGKKGQEWVIKNRSYEVLARQVEKRYLALLKNQ